MKSSRGFGCYKDSFADYTQFKCMVHYMLQHTLIEVKRAQMLVNRAKTPGSIKVYKKILPISFKKIISFYSAYNMYVFTYLFYLNFFFIRYAFASIVCICNFPLSLLPFKSFMHKLQYLVGKQALSFLSLSCLSLRFQLRLRLVFAFELPV